MTDFAPKVTKIVTRPVLKLEKEKPVNVRMLAALYVGSLPAKRAGSTREPVAPTFVDVEHLDDNNAAATLPIHPKLKKTLTDAYPDNSYVGKCFSITAKTRQQGRQFTPFHLVEIEDPKAPPAPVREPEQEEKPTQLHRNRR